MLNQARLRTILRWGHIGEGMFLVAYVYSGFHSNTILTNIARFLVMPLIVVSGLWLWQQGRIVRWTRSKSFANERKPNVTADQATPG
jgi:hypothetical protein